MPNSNSSRQTIKQVQSSPKLTERLAGRQGPAKTLAIFTPRSPLGSPVQFQNGNFGLEFNNYFRPGPNLERGELSFRPLGKRNPCHDAASPLKPSMSGIEGGGGELARARSLIRWMSIRSRGPIRNRKQSIALLGAAHWVK